MNRIKALFISAYSAGAMAASVHIAVNIFNHGFNTAWLGALIATLPPALFFAWLLGLKSAARTSSNLPHLIILGVAGLIVSVILPSTDALPIIYAAGFGVVGSLLYIFWYSRIDRSAAKIEVGKILPNFTIYTTDMQPVQADDIRKQAALILFFRGNWCPLCMAQIKEIAASYRELDTRGVKVYLVSPQSERHSKSLSKQFDAPMNFMIDKNLEAAKSLGLMHENGTPMGMMGYESDTVMPTAVLTDASGTVIFADLTDNYRVRPEPQTFLDILDKHLATS